MFSILLEFVHLENNKTISPVFLKTFTFSTNYFVSVKTPIIEKKLYKPGLREKKFI